MIKSTVIIWGLVVLNVAICVFFTYQTRSLQNELEEANKEKVEYMMSSMQDKNNGDILLQRIEVLEQAIIKCRDSINVSE